MDEPGKMCRSYAGALMSALGCGLVLCVACEGFAPVCHAAMLHGKAAHALTFAQLFSLETLDSTIVKESPMLIFVGSNTRDESTVWWCNFPGYEWGTLVRQTHALHLLETAEEYKKSR